jgi:hypothetical protein
MYIDFEVDEPKGCSNCGNDVPDLFVKVTRDDFGEYDDGKTD